MQGFIVNIQKVSNEDLIVNLITRRELLTLYRFYGARHSTVNIGYKIDFEIENTLKSNMPRLRRTVQLGQSWLNDKNRLLVWQQFTALFYPHLRENELIDSFYFKLLDKLANQWHLQSPKRLAVEAYVQILEHEGRLHTKPTCFVCNKPIYENLSFIRAFLPAHSSCIHERAVNMEGVAELIENKSSLFLSDMEVDKLWGVVLQGL